MSDETTEQTAGVDVEAACEVMHDAYEQAAVAAGWETQQASRKPWADVPEGNKATMRVAVGALLDHLAPVIAAAEQRGREQGRDEQAAAVEALLEQWSDFEHEAATCPKYDCGDCTMLNAIHDLRAVLPPNTDAACDCESMGGRFGAHRRECPAAPNTDAALANVRAEALRDAADDVRRVRKHGLRPGEGHAPYTKSIEQWLRDRADRIAVAALTPAEPAEG